MICISNLQIYIYVYIYVEIHKTLFKHTQNELSFAVLQKKYIHIYNYMDVFQFDNDGFF
jgi:ABC-type transport system involved in Fe-S cluster assembly fused permease/ATPase subunit